ncbi:curlin repeat-containing protein [Pseudovibrio ascidiaceicola]|uniref:curlin repeat-containing protein n=1 Tax=Pseudovibrio ascidiaceicola TaxID=285279 RepID=UPI003D364DBB
MKQILILSCSALALSVAAAHAGNSNASQLQQVNLGGDGNTGVVTQIGSDNQSIVIQTNSSGSTGNSATVLQTGDSNIAGGWNPAHLAGELRQNGGGNSLSVDQDTEQMVRNVLQQGDNNTLTIKQRATAVPSRNPNHRVWNVTQDGVAGATTAQNELDIDQRGDTNVVATVYQENTSGAGAVNTAEIRQRGAYNGSNINGVPPDPQSGSHGATLKQTGSGNDTYAFQAGSNNNFWLESIGDNNVVELTQDGGSNGSYAKSVIEGNMNNAVYFQTGNSQDADVAVTGDNFMIRTKQSGADNGIDYAGIGTDGRVSIHQIGAGNTATANSNGDDQYIALKQRGDNNSISIAGLNGPNKNKFYVLQKTNGSTVSVGTVEGSFNRLQFIQKGGDGNQILWGDVYGDQNKVFFTQNGSGNTIEGNIGDLSDPSTSNGNRLQVAQIGDDNTTLAAIMGNNNTAQVGQKGNMNFADVSQTGDNNSATIMQGAANVNLPTIMTDSSVPFQTLDGSS